MSAAATPAPDPTGSLRRRLAEVSPSDMAREALAAQEKVRDAVRNLGDAIRSKTGAARVLKKPET